jgi:outer membrane lipopolysaccharide assembly protein LptE/RlpB
MVKIALVRKSFAYAILLGGVLLSGCGYHVIGQGNEALSGIHCIAIPYFANKSYEAGLERYVTEALVDEFVKSRMYSIVPEKDADAVLRGTIEAFKETAIAYDKDNYALEYRASLKLDATLEMKDTGDILWRTKELHHFEDYRVAPEIAATEANKNQAIGLIAREVATRMHDSIVEGF